MKPPFEEFSEADIEGPIQYVDEIHFLRIYHMIYLH